MQQTSPFWHLTDRKLRGTRNAMVPVNVKATWASTWGKLIALAMVGGLAAPALQAQSGQTQSPPPAASQPAQDIPEAPSTVPPPAPKPAIPVPPPGTNLP